MSNIEHNLRHVDASMLDGLKELLGDRFVLLIEQYLADCSARIARIEPALACDDLLVVKNEAHGLKGSCRNIGANALAQICADIEDRARFGEAVGLQQKFADVQQEFAAVSHELETLIR